MPFSELRKSWQERSLGKETVVVWRYQSVPRHASYEVVIEPKIGSEPLGVCRRPHTMQRLAERVKFRNGRAFVKLSFRRTNDLGTYHEESNLTFLKKFEELPPMKIRAIASGAFAVAVLLVLSVSNASAFGWGASCGCDVAAASSCCEPSCGLDSCCAPSCDSCCRPGLLKSLCARMKARCNKCCAPSCCDVAPSCGCDAGCAAAACAPSCGCDAGCAAAACAPTCGCDAGCAPSCGCDVAPSCCDPCCRGGLFTGLFSKLKARCAAKHCCAPACCEPACGCEPTCGCN